MGIECVFSPEPRVVPRRDGTVCAAEDAPPEEPGETARRLNCDWGYGSAAFVTGAFGFAAAAWAVRILTR